MILKLLFVISLQLFGLAFYGQKLDNCGVDNSPLMNSYEEEFLNHFFKDKRTEFNFKNKKVGFFFGPNGQHLGCKKKYFNKVKGHGNPSCYLIKLSENEKTESGGYDILIVTWSKIFRKKPTRKMIKSLQESRFEYQDCMN
jgi:hypothetical protein